MFAVTVEFKVKAEKVTDFRLVMLENAKASLNEEPGCHYFDVCFSPDDDSLVFLYELYTDKAAFDAHLETAHYLSFRDTVADWLEDKKVQSWERVE